MTDVHYSRDKPGTFHYTCSSEFSELKLTEGEVIFLETSCKLKFVPSKSEWTKQDVYLTFYGWNGGDQKSAGTMYDLNNITLDSESYSSKSVNMYILWKGCDGKIGTRNCEQKCDGEINSDAEKGLYISSCFVLLQK